MRRKQTEIVIETSEVYIVRHGRQRLRAWCRDCEREVSLITPGEAALLTFQDTGTILSMMAEKRIHFRLAAGKVPYVCLTSLCLV
jgi:hypothetical protein